LNGAPDGAQFLSRADQMFPQRDGKFFLSTENLTSRRALSFEDGSQGAQIANRPTRWCLLKTWIRGCNRS